jgi:hypothetical protein
MHWMGDLGGDDGSSTNPRAWPVGSRQEGWGVGEGDCSGLVTGVTLD